MARDVGRMLIRNFEELVAGAALVVVVASVFWGVITRYITEQPATWASEVAAIAFAWLVFFGSSACFRHNAHPSIDMMVSKLPAAWQALVRWTNHLLLVAFLIFLTGYAIMFTIEEWENPTSVLRLPLSVLYGPIALGCLLMLVRYLAIVRDDLAPRAPAAEAGR